jgi:hypothetical protein
MALAAMPTIIKPDDLVRTRDGRITARCIEILPHHYRRLQNVLTGARFMAHVDDLVVIQAAVPRPWPKERR